MIVQRATKNLQSYCAAVWSQLRRFAHAKQKKRLENEAIAASVTGARTSCDRQTFPWNCGYLQNPGIPLRLSL